MSEPEVIEEDVVEENLSTDPKPEIFSDDDFEIITDDAEFEEKQEDTPETPAALSQEEVLSQAETKVKDDRLLQVLETMQQNINKPPEQPVAPPPAPIDWDKKYVELADKMSDDPAAAIKELKNAMTQEIGGAMSYQQAQIVETQKEASKLLARATPEYSTVFEQWGEEVEEAVKNIRPVPGQSATDIYTRAAREVKADHIEDIVQMKVQEAVEKLQGVNPVNTKVGSSASQGQVIEGKNTKPAYKFTPEQHAAAKRSMNPDRYYKNLVSKKLAKRVR